jgi:secondary thiamine-phosphate synthase enzyme
VNKISVRTSKRTQMVDITSDVQSSLSEAGLSDGLCVVFVPHTTAGVTINENADPAVVCDLLSTLSDLVPENGDYTHAEGNSDAHLKASIMGFSVQVIVEGGRLQLGTWQGIYFCEFDGPRNRQVWLKTIAS